MALEQLKSDQRISDRVDEISRDLILRLSGKDTTVDKKIIDNIFSFMSLSGGAGASTLLANVASRLSSKGLQVVVVDLNIAFPVQQLFFGSVQKIDTSDLVSVIMGDATLGAALEDKGGVYLLYSHNRLTYDKIVTDSAIAGKSFSSMLENLSSLFDVVLIDIPTRGDLEYEIANTALYESDFVYCIMDENTSCISSYNRILSNFSYMGISTATVKLIMNKRTNIVYPAAVFSSIEKYPDVILPYDISIVDTGLRGGIYVKSGKGQSKTSRQFVMGIDDLTNLVLDCGGYNRDSSQIVANNTVNA